MTDGDNPPNLGMEGDMEFAKHLSAILDEIKYFHHFNVLATV